MNQVKRLADVIDYVAAETEMSKKDAEKAIKAFLQYPKEVVAQGDKLQLMGEITFEPGFRAAREGRNPQTGGILQIEATSIIKVSVGKYFDDAVANCDFSYLKKPKK